MDNAIRKLCAALWCVFMLGAPFRCDAAVSQTERDVFGEAKWIGASSEMLPFFPEYLPVFKIGFTLDISPGSKASVYYGMNDPRLMNANRNIYNLENLPDSSWIKLEIDADGWLRLYRSGYHPDDNGIRSLAEFQAAILTDSPNRIEIASNLGHTDLWVNGEKIGHKGVNPVGNGGDYIAFPVVGEMAVEIPDGNMAKISDIAVMNFRNPGNIICQVADTFEHSGKISLPRRSMPRLRTAFVLPAADGIARATAVATSRGIYDMWVNGRLVTEGYFYPGSTQYNKTHLYNTFDITPYLHSGENMVEVQLAEGWWSGGSTYMGEYWNFFGDRQSFISKIMVTTDSGKVIDYVTNPELWQVSTDGPVVEGSFFQGEIFDATKLNDAACQWSPAVEIALDSTVCRSVGDWTDIRFMPDFGDVVASVDTITAIARYEPRPGVYVYDMGQNMAGVPLIEFEGLKRGQDVSLRYAEVLYPDMPQYSPNAGMVMIENLREAMCSDWFRSSGAPVETFSPRFTFHGFRYIEITGLDEPVPVASVKAVPLSSVHQIKAHFECSDTLVNRLWENILWSTRSNFISIPTDCPQRNERLGWMGDISVFAPTATLLADVGPLLNQYLQSVRDCQSDNGRFPDVAPTGVGFGGLLWGSAGITVPYALLRQYGDTAAVRRHYPSMQRYVDYVFNETIDSITGIIVQGRQWGDLADWLSPEYEQTDKSLLWECYLIYDLRILAEMASAIGLDDDAAYYRALSDARTKFFIDNYVDAASGKTVWSAFEPKKAGRIVDTAVSYALPIAMGIYTSDSFNQNFINCIERENIADDGTVCQPYSLTTGFIGTAWIAEALSAIGRSDVAYKMLVNREFPSWLYPVTQGATTIWERLNSYTHRDGFGKNNSMNSFNHYSFGAVGHWLITRSLGLNVSPAGKVMISPEPDSSGSLTFARGWLDTPRGRVESAWSKTLDGSFVYEITIPEGAEAEALIANRRHTLTPGHHTLRY